MADRRFQPETLAIHAGQIPDAETGARALPIYQTTSFVFDSAEHAAGLFNLQTFGNVYSRLSNPTVAALEERVAALEGGRAGLASASGMAAEAIALLTLLQHGDHVVAAGALYGGSVSLLAVNLEKLGITTTFVDGSSADAFAAAMQPRTRAVFAESLGNPSLAVLDIAAVAEVAHAHGVPLVVDNTVPSPFLCNPIRFGADIVVHSATKYLAGHGTTLGGVMVESGKFPWDNGKFPGMTEPSRGYHGVRFYETFGDFGFTTRARMETLRVYGAALSPTSAWQILQGVETLPLRMERHCSNALAVARFLQGHERVSWVNYPGLDDHPQHGLVARQMRSVAGRPGASGLLAFGVEGGVEAGVRFIERAQMMSHVANIGDTRTLVIHPASTTHRQLDDSQQLAAGVRPDMIRMSVGLEHIDDILWDIDQALAPASASRPGPRMNIYEQGLGRNAANDVPLSPVSFVERSGEVFGDLEAVVHGARRYAWRELRDRSARLAAALRAFGVGRGTTVSAMLHNTPEMVESHYAVPALGAVLNTLNTRLDAALIAWQLAHCECAVLITDRELAPTMGPALRILRDTHGRTPIVVDVCDSEYRGPGERLGDHEYEALLAAHAPLERLDGPADERDAIAVSYTSGTTGDPKGVVTHHRGAYLNAVCNAATWTMPHFPRYLWTLPMFHCNGWCFPWTVALLGGTHVCLRKVEAAAIYAAIRNERADHYCAAPIVHNLLIAAPAELRAGIGHAVRAMVAGAAPPASMIEGMARIGFDITHVYGLTEVYGPASVAVKRPRWRDESLSEQTRLNGRQGVRYALQEGMTVRDPESLAEVPADGRTMGEIMFRGNIVMSGYLKNPAATDAAFAGGWFHTGDLAVLEPDRYVKIRDRSKDVIISGGENISSLEVEDALYRHAAVFACAVVARPDPRWGETPVAFVELKPEATVSAADLVAHCRELLAAYKVPREVRFETIPKTSTGKIQKFELRERLRSAAAIRQETPP